MPIDRSTRNFQDKAPRFYPTEDGFTLKELDYMLKRKKESSGKEYPLKVSKEELVRLANKRISELYENFGDTAAFKKYFSSFDYSDRGKNSLHIQLGLASPRNPFLKVTVREYDMKKGCLEEKEINPLYDELEALEEMCLAFG